MPRYEVRLGRTSSIYERAYVTVDADDEYHAKALALDTPSEGLVWDTHAELFTDSEIELEACKEVPDD